MSDYRVFITDTQSGETREFSLWENAASWGTPGNEFCWTEGNFSCDCNRGQFFAEAAGLEDERDEEEMCGDGRFLIKCVAVSDGRILYDETDDSLPATVPGSA